MELPPHILALLGALTAGGGVLLILWGVSVLSERASGGTTQSLLAPTLAVDTLDDDLRVAYMRTLVLDARVQASRIPNDDPALLGRELRRLLLEIQASRHQGHQPSVDPIEKILDIGQDEIGAFGPAKLAERAASARLLREQIREDRTK